MCKSGYFKLICLLFLLIIYPTKLNAYRERDYLWVANSDGYVDKSLLIEFTIRTGRQIIITAPRRFMKSTNLDMLCKFFSVESLHDVEVFQTFRQTLIYKNKAVFDEHFAKYPVVYVDFKCGGVNTFKDALSQIRTCINEAYRLHPYLEKSSYLLGEERDLFVRWRYVFGYTEMLVWEIQASLSQLVDMLEKHHNHKVVVLVDQYDCLNNEALYRVESDEDFKKILSLTSAVLSNVVNNHNVKFALMVGTSYISSSFDSPLNVVRRYNFMDERSVQSLFSFTSNELKTVFSTDHLYFGYMCRNKRIIFNPYSVLRYMRMRKSESFWTDMSFTTQFMSLLKFPVIEKCVEDLLSLKAIQSDLIKMITAEDVLHLRGVMRGTINSEPSVDLFLTLLMDYGFLSYCVQDQSEYRKDFKMKVKLPNREIEKELMYHYVDFYVRDGMNIKGVDEMNYLKVKPLIDNYKKNKPFEIRKFVTNLWNLVKRWFASVFFTTNFRVQPYGPNPEIERPDPESV
uniref:AAA-ATPase-like domain-containing protein n=1 Tax=Clastoptera arizonana TaxID=38151 RepID=A0A1B6CQH1_9HEMI